MVARRWLVVLLGIVLSAMCSVCWGQRGRAGQAYAPGEVLVKFRPGASGQARGVAHRSVRGRVIQSFRRIGVDRVRLGRGRTVPAAMQAYKRNPNVVYAEPNFVVHALDTFPNDSDFSDLWGLHNTGQTGGTTDADVDAPEAWDLGTGSDGVVVAVIDSGVDYNHEDLAANMWTNPGEIPGNGIDDDGNGYDDDVYGYDFCTYDGTPPDPDPMDDNGHGSHCAGTIGAVGDNGIGVVGVNWTVRTMALKFLDSTGYGYTSDAIACVEYATTMQQQGVPVVVTNNSWGGGGFSQSGYDAIADGGAQGILFAAAAGNSWTDNDVIPHYPSSYDLDCIIAVASTDHNDDLSDHPGWWGSQYGATSVDLAAPGSAIRSTVPGNAYATYSGTSMATPHVAGAVALINDTLGESGLAAKTRILGTVDHLASLEGLVLTEGRLNLYEALSATAGPNIAYDGHDIVSTTDGDLRPDPGEDVLMDVSLRNDWADATNVTATLSTSDPLITITQDSATYGNITGGATATSNVPYEFSVGGSALPGHIVTFDLAINFDGGSDASSFDLTIIGDVDVFFVDDDDGAAWEDRFINALDATSYSYTVWEVATLGSPSADDLGIGRAVVWTTGADWTTTLSPYDEAQLTTYMNAGGKLFLSSQDVLYDIGRTPFMRDYVHVDSHEDDKGCSVAQGVPDDPISDGLNLSLSYPFTDYSDTITPDPSAATIFNKTQGQSTWPVALRYPAADDPSGGGTVVFLAFPFEAVSAGDRATLMQRVLDWLLPPLGNSPPFAEDDDYSLSGGPFLYLPAPGLLENDTDPDGDPMTASRLTKPTYGVAIVSPDGECLYAQITDAVGTDSFTYTVSDGLAVSNVGTVTITLGGLLPSPIMTLTVQDRPGDSGGAMDLLWVGYAPPPDFDHYRIYRSTSPFNNASVPGMTPLATVGSPLLMGYVDTTTTDGVDYYYTVTCVDVVGNESVAAPAVGPVQSVDNVGSP